MTSLGERNYVLAFNTGSSSLKFELFALRPEWRSCVRGAVRDIGRARATLQIEDADSEEQVRISNHAEAAALVLDRLLASAGGDLLTADSCVATAHRIVHGGEVFSAPARVTQSVLRQLRALSPLAPLHNPPALAVMDVVQERLAGVPMIAVFDTAFFRDLPEHVKRYAVPSGWLEDHGIQRYGFHGIAHQYLSEHLKRLSRPRQLPVRVVSLHLGQGCSMTALLDGRPVETSMGFTPLEGLIMGTRSGDVDAGAIMHMVRQGHAWQGLQDELNLKSGLFGLSGASSDVRELLALEDAGHANATLALAAFCHRIHKYLGAYAAVLGGIDALVFGGGIGENAPRIRTRICAGLEWLGLELDADENAGCIGREGLVSRASSPIEVHVIPVREEQALARAAVALLQSHDAPTNRLTPFT